MLEKVAPRRLLDLPRRLAANDPGRFTATGWGDRLTAKLLDIHDKHLRQMDKNGVNSELKSLRTRQRQKRLPYSQIRDRSSK